MATTTSSTSVLTPLQLDSGAGLLQNTGIGVSSELTLSISAYNGTALISPFLSTITAGSANILSNATIASLKTLASNTCPALSDSVPSGYPTLVVGTNPPGFTGLISTTASTQAGGGDVTKFIQAISIAQGYTVQTNTFINSAVNSQTYLGNTFTNMNDMITGSVTAVNLATGPFSTDLNNLGLLIDLSNLGDLGSPLALVQRITEVVGNIPVLAVAFILEGVPQEIVLNLTDPTISIADSVQKLMYQAMTKITDDALDQILQVLKVTTTGIDTMADLLNPYKLFPNSFQSLTAPTANGPRAIYLNDQGTVNSKLSTELPPYVLRTLA